MSIDPRTEDRVRDWLDGGPDHIPDYVLQDVMQRLDATPQARRRFLGRWFDRGERARRGSPDHDHPPDRQRRNRLMYTTTALVASLAVLALGVSVVTTPAAPPQAGSGTTLTVDADGGGDYSTIQAAVDAAADGDTIRIMPGTYTEAVVIDGKAITLRGGGERGGEPGESVIVAPPGGPTQDVGVTGLMGDEDLIVPYAVSLRDTDARVEVVTIKGADAAVILSGGAPVLDGSSVEATIFVTDRSRARVTDNEATTVRVLMDAAPTIAGNKLTSVLLEDFAAGTVVRENAFAGAADGDRAISVGDDASVTIGHNLITDPGTFGVIVGNNVLTYDENGTATIIGNHITGATGSGIEVHPLGRATIRDNTLVGNRLGIHSQGAVDVIEGNAVEGSSAGIVVGAGSPAVRDNTVRDSDVAITVGAGASPQLSGNRLCGLNGTGLVIGSGADPAVDDSNEICDAAPAG